MGIYCVALGGKENFRQKKRICVPLIACKFLRVLYVLVNGIHVILSYFNLKICSQVFW